MNNKPYSHSDEFTKYGQADTLTKLMMALKAFQSVESLKRLLKEKEEIIEQLKRQIKA